MIIGTEKQRVCLPYETESVTIESAFCDLGVGRCRVSTGLTAETVLKYRHERWHVLFSLSCEMMDVRYSDSFDIIQLTMACGPSKTRLLFLSCEFFPLSPIITWTARRHWLLGLHRLCIEAAQADEMADVTAQHRSCG